MFRALVAFFFFALILVLLDGHKRVTITDDLDSVVDDEEDDAWRQWGAKKGGFGNKNDLPPPDLSKMDPSRVQEELTKQHSGPSFGFVKLRSGVPRSREDVANTAMKWSKMLKAGSVEARFTAIDLNTIMFTMEKDQDLEELREFILDQQDAYEMKISDRTYRRPGDPPLDQVIERVQRHESISQKQSSNFMDEENSYDSEL